MTNRLLLVFLLAAILLNLTACAAQPTFSPTDHHEFLPPSLDWKVFRYSTNEEFSYSGNPTLFAKRGENFRIQLIATEADGVYLIHINPEEGSGEMSWECKSSGSEEIQRESKVVSLSPMSLELWPPHESQTSASLTYEISLPMECTDPNWIFTSGTAKLTVRPVARCFQSARKNSRFLFFRKST